MKKIKKILKSEYTFYVILYLVFSIIGAWIGNPISQILREEYFWPSFWMEVCNGVSIIALIKLAELAWKSRKEKKKE